MTPTAVRMIMIITGKYYDKEKRKGKTTKQEDEKELRLKGKTSILEEVEWRIKHWCHLPLQKKMPQQRRQATVSRTFHVIMAGIILAESFTYSRSRRERVRSRVSSRRRFADRIVPERRYHVRLLRVTGHLWGAASAPTVATSSVNFARLLTNFIDVRLSKDE